MGNRFIVWGRKHSVNRAQALGDWIGLGSPTPVVTPFVMVGPPRPPGPQMHAAGEGLRKELEVAARRRVVIEGAPRARGRPRKSVGR
jgi:hypothetical protein